MRNARAERSAPQRARILGASPVDDADQPVVVMARHEELRGDRLDVAADVVVEHRDVAARHVRDEYLVLVLDQLAEDAAHRDDVVVRVR